MRNQVMLLEENHFNESPFHNHINEKKNLTFSFKRSNLETYANLIESHSNVQAINQSQITLQVQQLNLNKKIRTEDLSKKIQDMKKRYIKNSESAGTSCNTSKEIVNSERNSKAASSLTAGTNSAEINYIPFNVNAAAIEVKETDKPDKKDQSEQSNSIGENRTVFATEKPSASASATATVTTTVEATSLSSSISKLFQDDHTLLEQNIRTRDHMEDYCSRTVDFMGDKEKALWVLCDGHCGDDVAKAVVERLPVIMEECLKKEQTVEEAITEAFRLVDEEQTEFEECGATCNIIYMCTENKERVVYSGNVGDSRAILVKGTESIRLSFDHKANVKSEVERVKSEGGVIVRGRLYATLAVTRALGDYSFKTDGVGLSNIPHITRTVITPEDKYVIIASDGIWDVINEEKATQLVKEAKNDLPGTISLMFVTKSMDLGSKDNISCIVIKLN